VLVKIFDKIRKLGNKKSAHLRLLKVFRKGTVILAIVLHPVMLFNYALGSLIFQHELLHPFRWIIAGLALCFMLPLSIVWLFTRDIHISNRYQRRYPLWISMLCILGFAVMLHYQSANNYFYWLIIPSVIAIFLVGLISPGYKISMHATGFGLALLPLIILFKNSDLSIRLLLIILLLAIISVLWQRRDSGAHQWNQLFAGLALGLIIMGTYLWLNVYL
jgi:hypothetical protein